VVQKDLMSMKVTELKELEARGRETETGKTRRGFGAAARCNCARTLVGGYRG
jgi:hypothetical protein